MFHKICRRIVFPFFRLFYRVKVKGLENLPKDKSFIIVSNHLGMIDCFAVAALFKQKIYFMAKKELFKIPLLAGLIRMLGAFPVDRAGDVGAIKTSVSLLESGKCVGMFPQGTRCKGRAPRESADRIKGGAGLLIHKTGVTVLPACLKTKKNKLSLFRRVDLILGEPISYETLVEGIDPGAMSHQALYTHMSRIVFERICALYEEAPNE